jgi:AI-2 transport protein TqsA
VSSISSIVAIFTLVLIYAGFLLAEQGSFAEKLGRLSNDPAQVARLQFIIADINARIGTYLALKTFINIVLGLISYLIMTVLGIEFAGFWAALIALFNYIPYLGSFLGVAFPVALSILQFGDVTTTLIVIAALAGAQMFVGNFLEPYLMGTSLNLSPFVILVSLMVWSSIWGVAGALLSVPITAILVIIFSEFEGTRPIAVLLSRDGRVNGERVPPTRLAA